MSGDHQTQGSLTVNGVYVSNTSPPLSTNVQQEFRLYYKRWFMLFIVCLLNLSNAMLWISFAPIANYTNTFYCTKDGCGAADWLSLVFMIVAIPVGFLAMWSVDSFGLRTGIWLGTWVNAVGAALRVVSSASSISQEARFPLVITGQIIASVAQPFIMYLPTKLAGQWFPESQRTVANTLGSMCNPLGIMTSMLISPHIVWDGTDLQHQMLIMNSVMLAPGILTVILVTIGVWSSLPPSPPTASAANVHTPFWQGFKKAIKNKSFMILVLCLGGGMGLFNAIYTLLEQILCPKGYSNSFSGLCGALLIGGGFIGSVITGIIVDKTKLFEEVAKMCFCFAAVAACAFGIISLKTDMSVPIAALCTLFGLFGFSIYPIGLEMGVECTYPVPEATSAGLIIISGQLQGIIFVILMSSIAGPPSDQDLQVTSTCGTGVVVQGWQVPNLVFCGITCALAMTFVLLFWPKYKRMEAEIKTKKQSQQLIQSANNSPRDSQNEQIGGSAVTIVTIT